MGKNIKTSLHEEVSAAKKVVICVTAKEYVTKSGLELSNKENKPETGVVVSFGEGKKPIEFEVGDTIVFRKYTDNRIYLGDTEYNFIQFNDVLGVVGK